MAIVGALSFFLVKLMNRNSTSQKRFVSSVFLASWLSVVLGSLAAALQIGFSPVFAEAGGIMVTIPAMVFWHVLIGLGEGAITTSLLVSLQRLQPALMSNLSFLKWKAKQ
jgi:cobalt/nickel transport system permease protein